MRLALGLERAEARHVQEGLRRLARLQAGDHAVQVAAQQVDVEHGNPRVVATGLRARAAGERRLRIGRGTGHAAVAQAQRQREVHVLLHAGQAAHAHRAQLAQPLDDLLHQDVGRRGTGGQADAAPAFEPLAAAGRSAASTM